MYRGLSEVDDRIVTRLRETLMRDEEFVAAARCEDGLLDRWSTYLVVTTDRLLSVRKVLLESTVRGVKLSRIDTLRAEGTTLRIEHGFSTKSYELGATEELRELVKVIEQRSSVTASQ